MSHLTPGTAMPCEHPPRPMSIPPPAAPVSGEHRGARNGFKPREVEEPVDYYFHRPLADALVQLLLPLPVTPNQVTVASGVVGMLAGIAMAYAALAADWWVAVGGALLLVAVILDCTDGQLARQRGTASLAGRILDGLVDGVVVTAAMLGQAAFLLSIGCAAWVVLPVGAAAAFSLLWHAGQYDASKNRYLHNVHPDFDLGGAALITASQAEQLRHHHAERGETFEALLMLGFDRLWLRPQERGGGAQPQRDADRAESEQERAVYRSVYRHHMRAWTWLGLGTHLFVLTASAWLAVVDPRAIWLGWAIILGPMNVLCAVLMAKRGALRRRYLDGLGA